MSEKPLKTVDDLIEHLQLHVPCGYKLRLLVHGCGRELNCPVMPSLFEVDKESKVVTIMADWN
jgi:hypothetical protein